MRIGVDIDCKGLLPLLKAYLPLLYMQKIGLCEEVEAEESRKGYHVIAYGFKIPFDKTLRVRRFLGDDPVRCDLDEFRLKKCKNVFWTKKVIRQGRRIIYLSEPVKINPLAEPWWYPKCKVKKRKR